jgi:hypothetical protein
MTRRSAGEFEFNEVCKFCGTRGQMRGQLVDGPSSALSAPVWVGRFQSSDKGHEGITRGRAHKAEGAVRLGDRGKSRRACNTGDRSA